jgi:hypothetical protein
LNCQKKYELYNKRWDDLLWFYAYNYKLIQDAYTSGSLKDKEMRHIPGYIQPKAESEEFSGSPTKRQKLDSSPLKASEPVVT